MVSAHRFFWERSQNVGDGNGEVGIFRRKKFADATLWEGSTDPPCGLELAVSRGGTPIADPAQTWNFKTLIFIWLQRLIQKEAGHPRKNFGRVEAVDVPVEGGPLGRASLKK